MCRRSLSKSLLLLLSLNLESIAFVCALFSDEMRLPDSLCVGSFRFPSVLRSFFARCFFISSLKSLLRVAGCLIGLIQADLDIQGLVS